MTTSSSHCTELGNDLNRPKDLQCQRGTSRLVQRNKLCRQETTALWKIQTCAAHRCTSGLSALTETHGASWANGTCLPLHPGWCFCTITVTRLACSCLRAGQPIFPLASWLLFFVLFCFCPCPMKTNSLKHSCRLGRAVWSRFSAILTTQMGFSGKSHFAPNCEVPRTRSTNRRFHINPYQMTANNISFGWIVGDRGIRGFRC